MGYLVLKYKITPFHTDLWYYISVIYFAFQYTEVAGGADHIRPPLVGKSPR